MKRREFLVHAAETIAWSSIVVTVAGCESGGGGGGGGGGNGTIFGDIGSNHGHTVSITEAQIENGGTVILTMSGGGHLHDVTLQPAEVDELAQGNPVTVTSDSGGAPSHNHAVTFTP